MANALVRVSRRRERSGGAQGLRTAYWPVLACTLAVLFVVAPSVPLWMRLLCVLVVAALPLAALSLAGATKSQDAGSATSVRLGLGLPGLCGCLMNGATTIAEMMGSIETGTKEAIVQAWFALSVPLVAGSVVGAYVALKRPTGVALVALGANVCYLLWMVMFAARVAS